MASNLMDILKLRQTSGEISMSKFRSLCKEINGVVSPNGATDGLTLPLKAKLARGEITVKEYRALVYEIEKESAPTDEEGLTATIESRPRKIIVDDGSMHEMYYAAFALLFLLIGMYICYFGGANTLGFIVFGMTFPIFGLLAGYLYSTSTSQGRSLKHLCRAISSLPKDQQDIWKDVPKIINEARLINGGLDFPFSISGSSSAKDLTELANRLARMSSAQRAEFIDWRKRLLRAKEKISEQLRQDPFENADGIKSAEMICPHCGERGKVRTRSVQQSKGIDGGKVTAAVLTGGVTLLAGGGLSSMEKNTRAHCDNCRNNWTF